jgi:hypothetical protein
MCNTIVGAGAIRAGAGATLPYGSSSGSGFDQKMQLRNTAFKHTNYIKRTFILTFTALQTISNLDNKSRRTQQIFLHHKIVIKL